MSWIAKSKSDQLPTGELLFFTNDGMVTADGLGVINILGDHNIETSASGDTITITDTNTHTVGDLVALTNTQNAYTIQTGRLFITAGNLKMASVPTVDGGVITYSGVRFLYSREDNGLYNLFLGRNSGNFDAIPTSNTGLGVGSLFSLTSGQQNVAIGWNSGLVTSDGFGNTYVGASVGRLNNGSLNTGIGYSCWYDFNESPAEGLRTGSYNIAIGHLAANSYRSNESSNIHIFNVNRGEGDQNTIRIGEVIGVFVGNTQRSYFAGIHDATVNSPENVVINSDGQLGSEPASFDEPATQFLASIQPLVSNVTGDGATYTLGTDGFITIYQNTGTNFSGTQYTAPKDGFYRFLCDLFLDGNVTGMDQGIMRIVTSKGTFRGTDINVDGIRSLVGLSFTIDKTIALDFGDTVSFSIQVFGGSGNVLETGIEIGQLIGITYLGA